MIKDIIEKIKFETNNSSDIVYRKKIINKTTTYIIYIESLTSSTKISDFIIRSLNSISFYKEKTLLKNIENNISNFKYKELNNYNDLCKYLNKGFTILLIDKEVTFLALETKANLSRSINYPNAENTIRGPKDSFVEDYQTNIGLIKKRIKTNSLWIKNLNVGKYTDTMVGIVSINGVVKEELINKVIAKISKINISGVVSSSVIKNSIDDETKTVFPTLITTERPDIVCNSLLEGKIAIVTDNSPYVIIVPGLFNDFFKTSEDNYSKSLNVSFTRILKYLSFFIAILLPGVYITIITYNQEMIPTQLLISFAIQRDGVPFPAFFEAFIMMISFEILRETDLRVPGFSGSALSIVGALILGDAAVSAGIVSPIMIIVIALTAICSLPFTEPELTNGLRWFRLLFMLGGSFLGIMGIVVVFIYFIINLVSLETFGISYFTPYIPTNLSDLKDSIIRFPIKDIKKRNPLLSNNIIKNRGLK